MLGQEENSDFISKFDEFVTEISIPKIQILNGIIDFWSNSLDKYFQVKYGCCSIFSDWFEEPNYWDQLPYER